MNALIPAGLALVALLTCTPAMADHHATTDAAAPSAEMTADTVEVAVTEYTLKDGTTKVVVEGDDVFVVGEDGTKTPAPDGDHETTTEGVTLKVMAGKLVKEEVPAEAAPAVMEEKVTE